MQPNPAAVGPYAFKDNQWVGYDDEAIARKKGEYVVANGLGGIMFGRLIMTISVEHATVDRIQLLKLLKKPCFNYPGK